MRLSELKTTVDYLLKQYGDVKLWVSYVEENEMLIHREARVEFELIRIPESTKSVLEVRVV